ncbi:hypothetical protein M5K25_008941 [Dendrobium thyrsiflorum]|uniref:Uncharacterized protein n=1 Tax=Dendrobium thyrsiflorum TaxID=117978 RepID=A0ABD0V9D0_DENTH
MSSNKLLVSFVPDGGIYSSSLQEKLYEGDYICNSKCRKQGEIILGGHRTQLPSGGELDAATSPGTEQYRAAYQIGDDVTHFH